ncbi:putative phosphohydrolase [Vibrio phage RYC]|nr:putative phosphohydrolase [Vibrio phage RYC]
MKMYQKARQFALAWHGDQMYGGYPYSYHLDKVDEMVCRLYPESPKLELLRTLAYLHDVLEDTDVPEEEIEREFGVYMFYCVSHISKRKHETLEDYYSRVVSDKLSYKVKLADTMANLSQNIKEGRYKGISKYSKQIHRLNELKEQKWK